MRAVATPQGMTLIEAVTAIAIFSIVSVSLYTIVNLGIKLARDDQSRLDAVSIAQSVIEQLHNVPYDSIGTVGGIPSGAFPQTATQVHNNTTFTVATDIRYFDDPFDGTTPTDPLGSDYKKIRVAVTWEGQYVQQPVLLITTIAPNGIESSESGGTLLMQVYDASSTPVANATVVITNTTLTPNVNMTSATDSNGQLLLPGAPASVQGYHIAVSKNGYSSSQTYTSDVATNPNPDPSDLTVVASAVTEKIFYIDRVSSMALHLQDRESGAATAGVAVHITGANRIGTDLNGLDIPKYDQTVTTNASGNIALTNLEYDTYTLAIDDSTTGVDLAGNSVTLPYVLSPNMNATMTLLTAPDAAHTLLVTAHNGVGDLITGASVQLTNDLLGFNTTLTTDSNGQAFFTPLNLATYTLTITTSGYAVFSDAVDVSDDTQRTIPLTPN